MDSLEVFCERNSLLTFESRFKIQEFIRSSVASRGTKKRIVRHVFGELLQGFKIAEIVILVNEFDEEKEPR